MCPVGEENTLDYIHLDKYNGGIPVVDQHNAQPASLRKHKHIEQRKELSQKMEIKFKFSIHFVDHGKPRKNRSQIGRHRGMNLVLPDSSPVCYHGATSLDQLTYIMS